MTKKLMPISLVDEVLVDLTNFLAHPLRTGIQRYFTEILANWPDGHSLLPFRMEDDQEIAILNPAVFAAISGYIRAECQSELDLFEEEIRTFTETPLSLAATVDLIGAKAILLPEITYNPGQLAFYKKALSYFGEKVFVLIYDFIPWLRPELYPDLDFSTPELSLYIGLLQKADNFVFISHKAKQDAERRVLRRPLKESLVLGGGADGLGRFAPLAARPPKIPHFVMVGTVQQRKQHFSVLDACDSLWRAGAEFRLSFVGNPGDFLTEEELARLEQLAQSSPWFQWEKAPLDSELAEILRDATATIYVSVEEGLGLPVLESLWLDIPVIVSDTLPVLDFMPKRGVRLVDPNRPESLSEAIKAFLVPGFAESVKAEIERDALPTWRGTAERLQAWIDPSPGGRLSAHRRIEMTAALHDLRQGPPERFLFEACATVFGRAPTGAEYCIWLELPGPAPEDAAAMAGWAVEWVVEAGAASGALSPAERSAWLISLEAEQGLPADFRFRPRSMAKATLIERGIVLLRTLLGCSDEQFIASAYQNILNRPPDPSGEAHLRHFLTDHPQGPRWARGFAIKSLLQSEESRALPENRGFEPVIEDLLCIDIVSDAEVVCFRRIADAHPSRWLFSQLLDLPTEPFLRFSTALVRQLRVSEVEIIPSPPEISGQEKLQVLKDLCRENPNAAHLIRWIDFRAPSGGAGEMPIR